MTVRRGRKAKRTGSLTRRDIYNVCVSAAHWLWRLLCLVRYLNPLFHLAPRHRQFYAPSADGSGLIKPSLWERLVSTFQDDVTSKVRLLAWCQEQIPTCTVNNLSTCWQDGVALCALMESTCPGVCPRYDLLKPQHKVNNCRLGLKLANKHLGIPLTIISPEDIALSHSETKLRRLLSLIKWSSQRRNTPYKKNKATMQPDGSHAQAAMRTSAKGSGLYAGVVNKLSKFNVSTPPNETLDLRIKIEGPEGHICDELITSRFTRKAKTNLTSTESYDWSANSYSQSVTRAAELFKAVLKPKNKRETSISDRSGKQQESNKKIPFDYQCVGECQIVINYIPRIAGKHSISIFWHNEHIRGSPYTSSIEESVEKLNDNSSGKVKQKKVNVGSHRRMQYYPNENVPSMDAGDELSADEFQASGALRRLAAANKIQYRLSKQATITRRRVLKKVMTKAGREIIIHETTDTSRDDSIDSLSRQTSLDGHLNNKTATRTSLDIASEPRLMEDEMNLENTKNVSTNENANALPNNEKEVKLSMQNVISRALMVRAEQDLRTNSTTSNIPIPSHENGKNEKDISNDTKVNHLHVSNNGINDSPNGDKYEKLKNENQSLSVDKGNLHRLYVAKGNNLENKPLPRIVESEFCQINPTPMTHTNTTRSNQAESTATVCSFPNNVPDISKQANINIFPSTENFIRSILMDIMNSAIKTASVALMHSSDRHIASNQSDQNSTSNKMESGVFLGSPSATFRPVVQAPSQITDKHICIQRPIVSNPQTDKPTLEQKFPLLALTTKATTSVTQAIPLPNWHQPRIADSKTIDPHHMERHTDQDTQLFQQQSDPSCIKTDSSNVRTQGFGNVYRGGPLADYPKDENTSLRLLQSDSLRKTCMYVSRHPAIQESSTSSQSLSSTVDHDPVEQKRDFTLTNQTSAWSKMPLAKQKPKEKLRLSLSLPTLSWKWKAFEIDSDEEDTFNTDEMEVFTSQNKQKRYTLGSVDLADSIEQFASLQKGIIKPFKDDHELEVNKLGEEYMNNTIEKDNGHAYLITSSFSSNSHFHSDSKSESDNKLNMEIVQGSQKSAGVPKTHTEDKFVNRHESNKAAHVFTDDKTAEHLFRKQKVMLQDICTQVSACEIKTETGWTSPQTYVRRRTRKVWKEDMLHSDMQAVNERKGGNSDCASKQAGNNDPVNEYGIIRQATFESAADSGITDDSNGHFTKRETLLHTMEISRLSPVSTSASPASSMSQLSDNKNGTHVNGHRIVKRQTSLANTKQRPILSSTNSSQEEDKENIQQDSMNKVSNICLDVKQHGQIQSSRMHSKNKTSMNEMLTKDQASSFSDCDVKPLKSPRSHLYKTMRNRCSGKRRRVLFSRRVVVHRRSSSRSSTSRASLSKDMTNVSSFEPLVENGDPSSTQNSRGGGKRKKHQPSLVRSNALRSCRLHGWIPLGKQGSSYISQDGTHTLNDLIKSHSPLTERRNLSSVSVERSNNQLGTGNNLPELETPETRGKLSSELLLSKDDSYVGFGMSPDNREQLLCDLNTFTCITEKSPTTPSEAGAGIDSVERELLERKISAQNTVAEWICQNPDPPDGMFEKDLDFLSIDENYTKETDKHMNDAQDFAGAIPKPDKCHAFGSGLRHGLVGVKNNFQVRVDEAGNGYLTTGVHGPNPNTVIETSVTFTGDNLYEILYEVTQPGYYIITVKWSEMNIPNSPFVCKVTY